MAEQDNVVIMLSSESEAEAQDQFTANTDDAHLSNGECTQVPVPCLGNVVKPKIEIRSRSDDEQIERTNDVESCSNKRRRINSVVDEVIEMDVHVGEGSQLKTNMFSDTSQCHDGATGCHIDLNIGTTDAARLILAAVAEGNLVAANNEGQTVKVACNVALLCKAATHQDRLDWRRDDMGLWKVGHRTLPIQIDSNGCKRADGQYTVRRHNFTNRSHPDLSRKEVYLEQDDQLVPVILIQYLFSGRPQPVVVTVAHGNSKTGLNYQPRKNSLIANLKERLKTGERSCRIYNTIVSTAEQKEALLPRAEKQLHDLKYNEKRRIGTSDPMRDIILLQAGEEKSAQFVKEIRFLPDNVTILLYLDDQVDYLTGCFNGQHSERLPIIHVDCTFNLSGFYAVVTSTKSDKFIGEPLLLGPILLTKRQRRLDYEVLWSALAKIMGDYAGYVVTDGEESLVQAVNTALPFATMLRCSEHLLTNVRHNASKHQLPQQLVAMVCDDTRAAFAVHWSQFAEEEVKMFDRWRQSAKSLATPSAMDKFISYFIKRVSPVIKDNLSSNHPSVQLPITNHAAESMNAIIRRLTVDKSSPYDLVAALKDKAMCQQREIQRGLTGNSAKFILKLNDSMPPEDFPCPDIDATEAPSSSNCQPSIDMTIVGTNVAAALGADISRDIERDAAGTRITSGQDLYIALDVNGKDEYIVRVKKNTLTCECRMYLKTLICAHTIASLKMRGTSFFRRFVKAYKPPTITQATKGSADAGKKPGEKAAGRHGGRAPKVDRRAEAQTVESGAYLAIYKAGRIKICTGCRVNFGKEDLFVLQHRCRLPYKSRTVDGNAVTIAPSTAGNHYFHLDKKCIMKNIYHSNFDGNVSVSSCINNAAALRKSLVTKGFSIV